MSGLKQEILKDEKKKRTLFIVTGLLVIWTLLTNPYPGIRKMYWFEKVTKYFKGETK